MARTIERRRTTRTIRGADEIKANLTNVAAEIGRVRDQARAEVESLEKIRGMLDTGYLENLLMSIEELEERIEELETTTLQSRSEVDRYQSELRQEQERLRKLWDAYKAQEDEIERLKRDYPLMEEKLFERERTIEQFKRDMAKMDQLQGYKEDYEALSKEHISLEDEMSRMEDELAHAQGRIEELEDNVVALQEVERDAGRVKELERLLDDERERLAKLYKVYEDLEAEKQELAVRADEWEDWYRALMPHMKGACRTFEDAPV